MISNCPHCADERLTSLDGIGALQKRHGVFDESEVYPDYFFCGTRIMDGEVDQSETCKMRVELSLCKELSK